MEIDATVSNPIMYLITSHYFMGIYVTNTSLLSDGTLIILKNITSSSTILLLDYFTATWSIIWKKKFISIFDYVFSH